MTSNFSVYRLNPVPKVEKVRESTGINLGERDTATTNNTPPVQHAAAGSDWRR